ncbi:MAG: hypothetical protein JNL98_20855 [Bryobacterales bacterium]|nr:hypothetical protein [Bryobacterales bacterium]
MLAELYLRKAKYADPIGAVPQGMEAARQHAAQAAREIKSARSMATLGMILLASERTTKDAADWFEQARSSDPQIEISYEYTTYLVARGFHQEAIQRSLAAIAAGHQIKMHSLNLGEIYYIAGQHDKAVGQLQRARKLYPDSWVPPSLLGLAALTQRQYLRASRWFYIGSKVSGSGSRRRLFQDVRGWLGDLMHAKRPAGTGMERTSTLRGAGIDVLCEAVIALVFGNLARCLYLLELLAEHEYPTLTWSIQWPIFEPLRQDPRYVALRRRLQVPARSSGPLLSHRTS